VATKKIVIELEIDVEDAVDVERAVDYMLDAGTLQDAIAEQVEDLYGGKVEFLSSTVCEQGNTERKGV
jgi:hypothetical protein